MVTDLHTRAGRETGVQEMLVSRWQKMLEAPFNTALDMIWTSFRAARIGKGHVNGAELSHDEAIQIAKQEWLRAVAYFHEVSEPDLVDYAIYRFTQLNEACICWRRPDRNIRSVNTCVNDCFISSAVDVKFYISPSETFTGLKVE